MDKLTKFGEHFNELMFYKNVTPEKLAETIGVNESTVYRWKNNKSNLSMTNLIKLANYFNCSLDFLLGRNNEILTYIPKSPMLFSKRLREIMKEYNISSYKLRKISRYDGKYFQKWDRGADPLAQTLIELADIFDCSIDYLIGRED